MKNIFIFFTLILFFAHILSCKLNSTEKNPKPVSPEQAVQANIDSIKFNCRPGDLITRLSDDMISEVIKQLSDNDKSFSHAGIVVIKNNQKQVCHIVPDDAGQGNDTIRYEPVDSFINPKQNLSCGWFRYNIKAEEINTLVNELHIFAQKNVRFDKHFDLKTDDELYCSEMIVKAIKKAKSSIAFKTTYMPENMIKMMTVYFKKFNLTYNQIKKTAFISIENLYDLPECKEIMRTKLKLMP